MSNTCMHVLHSVESIQTATLADRETEITLTGCTLTG